MLLRLAYLGVTNGLALLRLLPISDADKDAEILVLRHQIPVLQHQLGTQKPRFGKGHCCIKPSRAVSAADSPLGDSRWAARRHPPADSVSDRTVFVPILWTKLCTRNSILQEVLRSVILEIA